MCSHDRVAELTLDSQRLKFETIVERNGLKLPDDRLDLLEQYVGLLIEWNSKINLVSRADVDNIWFSHILHSIAAFFFLDFPRDAKVMDLGTGGGLPGIPMSIVRPDLRITLLDSIRKKTSAVHDMADKMQLGTTRVVTGRAEEIAREKGFRQAFDIVITRAVASLTDLVKWSRPLLKRSGETFGATISDKTVLNRPSLICLKGGDLTSEIQAAKAKSGLKEHTVINLVFDGSEELSLLEKKIIIVPF